MIWPFKRKRNKFDVLFKKRVKDIDKMFEDPYFAAQVSFSEVLRRKARESFMEAYPGYVLDDDIDYSKLSQMIDEIKPFTDAMKTLTEPPAGIIYHDCTINPKGPGHGKDVK